MFGVQKASKYMLKGEFDTGKVSFLKHKGKKKKEKNQEI